MQDACGIIMGIISQSHALRPIPRKSEPSACITRLSKRPSIRPAQAWSHGHVLQDHTSNQPSSNHVSELHLGVALAAVQPARQWEVGVPAGGRRADGRSACRREVGVPAAYCAE